MWDTEPEQRGEHPWTQKPRKILLTGPKISEKMEVWVKDQLEAAERKSWCKDLFRGRHQ